MPAPFSILSLPSRQPFPFRFTTPHICSKMGPRWGQALNGGEVGLEGLLGFFGGEVLQALLALVRQGFP
jgi:hypothetical protein